VWTQRRERARKASLLVVECELEKKEKKAAENARRKKPIEFFFFRSGRRRRDQALAFDLTLLPRFQFPSYSSPHQPKNSAERKQLSLQVPAAVTAAAGAMLASPLAASAEVTPSLKNLINSVVAGGVVLVAIVVAVTAVSGFDPVTRK
jgi:hypothetical protein